MKRMRIFLLKFCILIISGLLIDGGKTFIFAGTGFQYLTKSEHNNDLELPAHHQFGTLADNDQWILKDDNQIEFTGITSSGIIYNLNLKSQDFISSIWQPPRSL